MAELDGTRIAAMFAANSELDARPGFSPSRNGLPLYGRAVRNEDFCSNDETTALRYVPADDTLACPLQRCVQDSQSGGR